MTRKEILFKLKTIGCDETTYEDIKSYLRWNNWTLKNVTDIQEACENHCKLYVNGNLIGVI